MSSLLHLSFSPTPSTLKTFLALQLSLSPHALPFPSSCVHTTSDALAVTVSLSGETGDTKRALRGERDPGLLHSDTFQVSRVDRTPIVPPCILLISWKRSSQHRGTGRVGWGFCRGERGWMGEGGAPCWVVGFFVPHAKARPCSPRMPTPPTVACMLGPDWHRNRGSVKAFPRMTHSTLRTWTSIERSACPPRSSCILPRTISCSVLICLSVIIQDLCSDSSCFFTLAVEWRNI